MKLKLRPSGSARKVYLLIEANKREHIERAIVDYIGMLGWAKASPLFVEPSGKKGRFILAIERSEMTSVRAAFEASDSEIKITRISGTLKGLGK